MALSEFLVFLAVFLFVFAISRMLTAKRRRIALRIEAFDPTAKARQNKWRRPRERRERQVRPSIMTQFAANLETMLVQGEFQVEAREFMVRWLLVTLILAVLLFMFKGVFGSIGVFIVSLIATLVYLRSRGTRRKRRFEEGLHDMLTIAVNSLRAGSSFLQAIQVVTEDMQGPISQELTRVVDEMNVGVPLDQALKSASDRIASEDFQLIVTAILIQRQVGGNLAEVLEQIAVTIRERVRLKAEVKVLTSQGRMSSIIFMLLPIGLAGMMFVVDPAYIGELFSSLVGIVLVVFAAIMQAVGYMLIRKIVDIEL